MNLLDSTWDGIVDDIVANPTDPLNLAILIVSGLIILMAVVSLVTSIVLAIKYHRYNRTQNSLKLTGEAIARKILDDNDLQNIKVKATGSFMFGNSYSHYFKKVRLRRLTWKKDTVTSLAMAAQKSSLAILDKEGDPAMKARIVFTPIQFFGPLMFVPMIILGVLISVVLADNPLTWWTAGFAIAGLSLYAVSFVLTILTLKTEKKAQEKAYEILENKNMATEEELGMMKELFHLYNIQYINDAIIAFLEILLRVLQLLAYARGGSTSSNNN